jgi:hypothetical protein
VTPRKQDPVGAYLERSKYGRAIFEHLRRGNSGSTMGLSKALGLPYVAMRDATLRLRTLGVIRVAARIRVRYEDGTHSRSPADLFVLADESLLSNPVTLPSEAPPPPRSVEREQGAAPDTPLGIVPRAIASRPMLMTVWMGEAA